MCARRHGSNADVFRLPSRASQTLANDKPDRKYLCLSQTENQRDEEIKVIAFGTLSDIPDSQKTGEEFAEVKPCREVEVHQLAKCCE